MHQTLFKKDSAGAIRQWHIEVHDSLSAYRMVSGQVGGQLVASEWTACETINAGKKNERGPIAQCEFEVKAAYVKKKKEGYHDSIHAAETTAMHFFDPMLAKKYENYAADIWRGGVRPKGSLYAQAKLDGIRAIGTWNRLHTRTGEEIPSCFHILRALEDLPENIVLDGELYNHDLKDNFNELTSLVRKTKGWEKHQEQIKATIQYWVYDAVFLDEPGLTFEQRQQKLRVAMSAGVIDQDFVKLLGTVEVETQQELDDHYAEVLEQGFEGQMVRLNFPYENKRSGNLLKRKEFQDAEFIIIDVLEGIGNRSGMAGALKLKLGDGREFQSGIKGGRDHYRHLLARKDQYIGKPATIRFFHLTPDGIPRFPVAVDVDRKD